MKRLNEANIRRALCMLLLLAGWSNTAVAQKPPKDGGGTTPPPVLPGIIYHLRDQNVWAVRPDGTGLTQVLPTGFISSPNFRPQGANATRDRWYLERRQTGVYNNYKHPNGTAYTNYPHYDIFAYRTSPTDPSRVESIQLTNLFGLAAVVGGDPFWSVDDNDTPSTSHVYFEVLDISDTFVLNPDGTSFFDGTGKSYQQLRLPVTATTITAAWLTDSDIAFRPTTKAELTATLFLRSQLYADAPVMSPNKQFLVALQTGIITMLDPQTTLPVFVTWNGSTMGSPTSTSGTWVSNSAAIAPDSSRIVVLNYGRTASGGVWVVTLNGSAPPKQLAQNASKGNSYTEFDQVLWSPDSNYVLARRKSYATSTGPVYDQLILPASGGAAVVTFPKSPIWGIRWVASE